MAVPLEVQQLCKKVPWPPDETSVSSATVAQIEDAEKVLGIRFPRQLTEFLEYMNGPCIGPGGVFGVFAQRQSLDILEVLKLFPSWSDKGWIPVAGDGCGNYYVLVCNEDQNQPIAFIDTISSSDTISYVVASDYWHFLVNLLKRELGERRWPFSRDYVVLSDPQILDCKIGPFAWEAQ